MASDVKYPMLDDFALESPGANKLDWLYYMRGKYGESFEMTVFVIPNLSDVDWAKELNKLPWLTLAMHGWNHDEEEEITQEMLYHWEDQGMAKIYKGPNWKLPGNTKDNVLSAGFILVTKPIPENYIQGHIWNTVDLGTIEEEVERGVAMKKL